MQQELSDQPGEGEGSISLGKQQLRPADAGARGHGAPSGAGEDQALASDAGVVERKGGGHS